MFLIIINLSRLGQWLRSSALHMEVNLINSKWIKSAFLKPQMKFDVLASWQKFTARNEFCIQDLFKFGLLPNPM